MVVALPGLARAAAPSEADLAHAREWFEQGRRFQEQGQWRQAGESYQRALGVKDTPGLRYRVGYCHERLGRLVEAAAEYRRAAQLIERGAAADDVAAMLPETIASLDKRTPHALLRLDHPPTQVQFSIDGVRRPADLLNQRVPLNPGTHVVHLSAPGYQDYSHKVVLQEGDLGTLQVSLTRRPTPPVDEVPSPMTGGSSARVAVVAAELVVAAGGAALGLVKLDEMNKLEGRIVDLQGTLDNQNPNDTACEEPKSELADLCARVQNAVDDYDEARTWMRVGFITAGVGATAAVVTYLVWPTNSTSITAEWFEGGGGIALRGQF